MSVNTHWEYFAEELQRKLDRKEVAYETLLGHFAATKNQINELNRDVLKYRRALQEIKVLIPEQGQELTGLRRTIVLQKLEDALRMDDS